MIKHRAVPMTRENEAEYALMADEMYEHEVKEIENWCDCCNGDNRSCHCGTKRCICEACPDHCVCIVELSQSVPE